ncbi:hypothetical protein NAC44_19820 [Allorhizobium sp. BGMRC 0089]|uniref:NepR family anti-sigma factor n=1 Tax=Allorhizobium sonneratiae TaxID=2934936 RepID=UPI002034557A|nr:NepR family anti-sigma factor [Allorhizobium sonneratiae]MCM2294581.1 hypothetical protein [Allorhizobium sonneratiae]
MVENSNRQDQADTAEDVKAASGAFTNISAKLRQFYNAVQEEQIPDRFVELLERLEQAEKNAGLGLGGKDHAS